MPAGYFLGPTSTVDPRAYWGPPPRPTAVLLNSVALSGRVPAVSEVDRERLVEDLTHWRAAVVVLGEQPNEPQLRAVLEVLLGPGTRVAGVWLWDVRDLVETVGS